MSQKTIAIAAVLAAALLTGIFSTSPMTAYAGGDNDDDDHDDDERYDGGDSSETNTEQKLKQENVGSGASTNFNCGTNSIDTIASVTVCGAAVVG